MFACFGGDEFWPLTAEVAVLKAPLERTVAALGAPGRWRRSPYHSWRRHATLREAVTEAGPYPIGDGNDTVLFVGTATGWTAVLSTAAYGMDTGYFSARARYDVKCDCVAMVFRPEASNAEPGARFVDYRHHRRYRGPWHTDEFSIAVLREERPWHFERIGPGRPYEQTAYYDERVKADRLPFELLARYAAAVGVPVDDPGFLTGPVVSRTPGQPGPPAAERWATIAELRAHNGYPPIGVVTTLTARRRRAPARPGRPRFADDSPALTRLTPDDALPVWIAEVPAPQRWSTLVATRAAVDGWQPLLLPGDPGSGCAALDSGNEITPAGPAPDERAVLASASEGRTDPVTTEMLDVTELPWPDAGPWPPAEIGLLCFVPAPSAADLPATLEWDGPMPAAELVALLRRWSRLFGAVLVRADTEESSIDPVLACPPSGPDGHRAMLRELESCCDELSVLPSTAAPVVSLWWD